jgi:hypothetical protein
MDNFTSTNSDENILDNKLLITTNYRKIHEIHN